MRRDARTVLWAVDPFEEGRAPPAAVAAELAEIVRRAGNALVPVHVISALERGWETGDLPLVPEIQAAVDRYVSRLAAGGTARACVLVDDSGTRSGGVRALLDLAEAQGAEWITVTTHGHAGTGRFMLGGFAETLVELSPLPVLFLPRSYVPSERRVALFPTDLTSGSRKAFHAFLKVAARQRLEVVLLHALSYPVPQADFGFGPVGLGPVVPESYLREQTDWAAREGGRLVDEARARGVRARFHLEAEMLPAISGDAVLGAARKERARVVAMAHLSGPVARFVAGSVAQEVFRSGRAFAWLYGPKACGARGAAAA